VAEPEVISRGRVCWTETGRNCRKLCRSSNDSRMCALSLAFVFCNAFMNVYGCVCVESWHNWCVKGLLVLFDSEWITEEGWTECRMQTEVNW